MDTIDTIALLSWSAMMVGLFDISGIHLIALQAGWLAVGLIGRKIVDRYVARMARGSGYPA
jgi:hypothetical protein